MIILSLYALLVSIALFGSGYIVGVKMVPHRVKEIHRVLVPNTASGQEAIFKWQKDLAENGPAVGQAVCWAEGREP